MAPDIWRRRRCCCCALTSGGQQAPHLAPLNAPLAARAAPAASNQEPARAPASAQRPRMAVGAFASPAAAHASGRCGAPGAPPRPLPGAAALPHRRKLAVQQQAAPCPDAPALALACPRRWRSPGRAAAGGRRGGACAAAAAAPGGAAAREEGPWSSFDPDSYQNFDDDDTELSSDESDWPDHEAAAAAAQAPSPLADARAAAPAAPAARAGAAPAAAAAPRRRARRGPDAGADPAGARAAAAPRGPLEFLASAAVSAWVALITLLLRALRAARARAGAAAGALARPLVAVVPRGARRQIRQLVRGCLGRRPARLLGPNACRSFTLAKLPRTPRAALGPSGRPPPAASPAARVRLVPPTRFAFYASPCAGDAAAVWPAVGRGRAHRRTTSPAHPSHPPTPLLEPTNSRRPSSCRLAHCGPRWRGSGSSPSCAACAWRRRLQTGACGCQLSRR